MPEIVEVYITALELNDALKDGILVDIDIRSPSKVDCDDKIRYLYHKLKGVTSKGKKILFIFDSFIIGCSLGMEGHWGYIPRNNLKHTKIILDFSGTKIYFDDTRCFGRVSFLNNKEQVNDFLKHVGIDLLRERNWITDEKWLSEFKNKKLRNKEVCDFLLEQQRFSGIGNYLRAEILFDARISPFRKLGDLSENEILQLKVSTFKIIDEAYKGYGLTIATYSTPSGVKGIYECKVYGKQSVEGYPVIKEKTKDRAIHYCPDLQK